MADINWYAPGTDGLQVFDTGGSGIGFFGGGFGFSTQVGQYQDSTFITNSAGTAQGPQISNVKYMNIGSGIINGASSGVPLISIPNYLATLNIRFTHSTPVKTQNTKLRIYDRSSISNDPSGVSCAVAEIIKPDTNQGNPNGSGDTTWNFPTGSSVIMDLVDSPGTSGLSPNGPDTTDTRMDWYVALSASPNEIGSKQFALYVETEYL